ncbi:jg2392 [Pararge aegeria aegeria]|uniref:Jg2392 protein n=1 Tax=Pararge aegeria aegeria TaxID=348720 RepID=A0A8S4S307_9NEOP|nr:jg2392 [Pararge aegeria aegeria]
MAPCLNPPRFPNSKKIPETVDCLDALRLREFGTRDCPDPLVLLSNSNVPGGCQQRPPSSSLSYGGAVNDDVRSPGSGGTPGPLSQPPPQTLDATDPGEPLTVNLPAIRPKTGSTSAVSYCLFDSSISAHRKS